MIFLIFAIVQIGKKALYNPLSINKVSVGVILLTIS